MEEQNNNANPYDIEKWYREGERQMQQERQKNIGQHTNSISNWEFMRRASLPVMSETSYSEKNKYPTYLIEINNDNDSTPQLIENISIENWKHPKSFDEVIKNPDDNGLKFNSKIAGEPKFSVDFQHEINLANCNNITGLEDERLKLLVFEALVERECTRQWHKGNRSLHSFDQIDCAGFSYEISVDENNNVCCRRNRFPREKTTWVNIVMKFTNASRLDALKTLAKYCGMDVTYLTNLGSNSYAAENGGPRGFTDQVPEIIKINEFHADQSVLTRVAFPQIYGNAGQVIGAIAMYKWNDQFFCLPATVANGEMSIGKFKPKAFFLNQHMFERHLSSPIVMFQDMRTAIRLQEQLDRIPGYKDYPKFIVTSHLGYDLSVLPWNYLYLHDIIFVPAPTKFSISMAKAYAKFCDDHRINSFKVAENFILPF